MCKVCGCSAGGARIEGQSRHHQHNHDHAGHSHLGAHAHDTDSGHHDHHRDDDHVHEQGDVDVAQVTLQGNGDRHFGRGPAGVHVAGMSQSRLVRIEQDILAKNREFAEANRARLAAQDVLALNLVSSPGAGKTTLLVATIIELKTSRSLAVIEGDQETSNDADRIRATGVAAIQINTGRGCHLDAHMVGHALDNLPIARSGILFIENVGNLVCPAGFDLGERHKVAILSVTEGDDKPLKYPDAFAAADLMVLSKVDLLPHVDFDVERCIGHARAINPTIAVLLLSARTGEGMNAWLAWIASATGPASHRAEPTPAGLAPSFCRTRPVSGGDA